MSKYIEKVLGRNEKILKRGKISLVPYIPGIIVSLLLLPVFGIGLIGFLVIYIDIVSKELAMTNKRVIAKRGFIRRSVMELRLSRVESIGVDQGIIGRIFNFGSVIVIGTGGTKTPISAIKNPLEFRSAVYGYLDELEGLGDHKHIELQD